MIKYIFFIILYFYIIFWVLLDWSCYCTSDHQMQNIQTICMNSSNELNLIYISLLLKILYSQGDYSNDQEITIPSATQYHLTDLREFTEYSFWVSAFNENGEGAYSDEVTVRTHSDIPADPPQNVTLESASSTSIIGQ